MEVNDNFVDYINNNNNKKKKKIKKKNIIIIFVLLLILAGITAGIIYFLNNKTEEPTNDNNNNQEVKEVPKLKILDENSTSRPYAIMINNHPTARNYHSGLQDAYIIYEIIVEGGMTRYMALFMDQNTERIGSVRSSRHYFLDYALENDAIYVHHGYSPQAQSDFSKLGVDRIEVSDSTGWRDRTLGISYEHTLFTSIEKLGNGLRNKRLERNKDVLFKYSIDKVDLSTIESAKKADIVTIKYSNSVVDKYEFDKDNEYYLRSVNNKVHKDFKTGEQYHFKNIITYKVGNSTIPGDEQGRQTLDNIGSGEGYYISNGYAVPIKWTKSSRDSKTKYSYLDGTEINVNDGNTFINIVPNSGTINIEEIKTVEDVTSNEGV